METGARIRWIKGNIVLPSAAWKSPSKRRTPRLLVEHRAKEVGIAIFIDGSNLIFHETSSLSTKIGLEEAIPLIYYAKRYYLIPERVNRQDTLKWLQKTGNCLLLWCNESTYYIKTGTKGDFFSN